MELENMPIIIFRYGTQAEYDQLLTKNPDALYIIEDKGRIYKGEKLIAEKNAEGGESPDLAGYVFEPKYEGSVLTMKVNGGPDFTLDFTEMLQDKFLTGVQFYPEYKEGKYAENPAKNVIVFTISGVDDPLVVPIGDVMTPYTAQPNGKQIQLHVENYELSADLVITDSAELDGTAIVAINPDGTLVAKKPEAFIGEVIADALKEALADSEILKSAVEEALTESLESGALHDALEKKMEKLGEGDEGDIVVSEADGSAKRSGVRVEDLMKMFTWKGMSDINREVVTGILEGSKATINAKLAESGNYAFFDFTNDGGSIHVTESGKTTTMTQMYNDIVQTLIEALAAASDKILSIAGKSSAGVQGETIELNGAVTADQIKSFVKALGLTDGDKPVSGATKLESVIGQTYIMVVNDVDGGTYDYTMTFNA